MKKKRKDTKGRNTVSAQRTVRNEGRTYINPYESTYTPSRSSSGRNKKEAQLAKETLTAKKKKKSNSVHKKQKTANHTYTVPEGGSAAQRRAAIKKNNRLTKKQKNIQKRRRRRYLRLRMLLLMVMTTLMVWGGISLKEYLSKPKVSYQVVEVGTLDTSVSLDGVVLRNEQVFNSQSEGVVQYIVSEGEKVKKGGAIYALVDEANLDVAATQQEDVDETLYHEADKRQDISYYQDDLYSVNQVFANQMKQFYNNRMENSTSYIYTLRSQLDQTISNRKEIYTTEQNDLGSELPEKIELTQDELSQAKYICYTSQSGVISYKMDGVEMQATDESVAEIDYEAYKTMIKESNKEILNQTYVSKDTPLYKLIFEDTWYILSYVDVSQEGSYTEGATYPLTFDKMNNETIAFTLLSKQVDEKYARLVFKTDNKITDFLDERSVQFSIGNKNESGLKIPAQALVEQNVIKIPQSYVIKNEEGQDCVYRQRGEAKELVVIDAENAKDDMVYIMQDINDTSKIQLNDVLVMQDGTSPYTVSESEVVTGVYVVNLKMAQFKPVDIYLQSGDYVLIKQNSSSQLKAQDKIISNPKGINMDELLKDMNIQNE